MIQQLLRVLDDAIPVFAAAQVNTDVPAAVLCTTQQLLRLQIIANSNKIQKQPPNLVLTIRDGSIY